jgi:hypothetical protein
MLLCGGFVYPAIYKKKSGVCTMRKIILLLLIVLTVSQLFGAEDEEKFPLPAKGSFGILFSFSNIPINVAPYTDSVLAGAGVKYCISDKLRLRGLVGTHIDPQGEDVPSLIQLGLSAAGEYHFKPGLISPYLGAVVGIEMEIIEETAYELHFGVLGGAEIRIIQNFSVFAEYGAIFEVDEDGLWFNLGQSAVLGVIIYLN